MQKNDLIGKYWHELTKEEKKILRDSKVTTFWLADNIQQPPWCDYPKLLVCQMGTWTLLHDEAKISEKFCGSGTCGYFMRIQRTRKEG